VVKITVIPACVVEHEAEVRGVAVLSRIRVARGRISSNRADFTPGFVSLLGHDISRGVSNNVG